MAQPKYTIYKYVRLKGGWRYCPAALYANHTTKPDVTIVGGKEERPGGPQKRPGKSVRMNLNFLLLHQVELLLPAALRVDAANRVLNRRIYCGDYA